MTKFQRFEASYNDDDILLSELTIILEPIYIFAISSQKAKDQYRKIGFDDYSRRIRSKVIPVIRKFK